MRFDFSNAKKPISSFSLAGLTDIVLLLLIFFLLTSNFIPQFGIQVNLPEAVTAAPMQDQYVTVVITEDGLFYVEQNRVPREGLLDAITQASDGRTTLVLRADRNATVGQFAEVGGIAKALNMRLLMATERGLRLR